MNKSRKQTAVTLVECMITILVLMITIGGILSFRYQSVLNAQRAEDQLLAARAANVLAEAWRGSRGATDFDPIQQGFDSYFQIQDHPDSKMYFYSGPSKHLGKYQVMIEGRTFNTSLFYQNNAGMPNARMLTVILTWQDGRQSPQQYRLSTLTRTNS